MKRRIRKEKEEDLLGALRERDPELERVRREICSTKRKVKDCRMQKKMKGNA